MTPVSQNSNQNDHSENSSRKSKQKEAKIKINEEIYSEEVRVISNDGVQLGIMNLSDALNESKKNELDLVEISPTAKPPVCKIMDYGKFKYQKKRQAALAKKKQIHVDLKEIKFRPKTDKHDFDVKVNRLKKILIQGNKGKVTMMFRGREIVHPEIGQEVMKLIMEELKDYSIVETKPKLEGRQMNMILSPLNKK